MQIGTKFALSAACILAATTAFAEDVSNPYDIELGNIYATTQPGSPDPSKNAECEAMFGEYLGQRLTGKYSINTSTLMMTADAVFLGETTKLFPLGIMGTYAFMSDGVPPGLKERKVNRIVVNVSTNFETVEGDVMLVPGGEFNCILSNMPANGG